MDVSGWTIDQRMRFPDWCFGNREVISCYQYNSAGGTRKWEISEIALPDPACVWQVGIVSEPSTTGTGTLRIGLADTLPTSEAEMNAALEILPAHGRPRAGPNDMIFNSRDYVFYSLDCRRGMETGGKFLVIECFAAAATMRLWCILVVSGLPTQMAGWLAHHKT